MVSSALSDYAPYRILQLSMNSLANMTCSTFRRSALLFNQFSLGLWITLCVIANARNNQASEPSRPNVLYVIVDDLGYGELGCYGGTEIPTPNIDALAASGARCTSGYVTAPFCAASRAAILTGRYQTRFGFEFNPIGAKNAEPGIGLPVSEKTLADRLRGVGYVTGLVGKWHQGGTAPFHPIRRGFDEFYGFLHEGHYYVPPPWKGTSTWLRRTALPNSKEGRWVSEDESIIWSTHMGHREPDYDADNPIVRGSQPVEDFGYLTDTFTDEACSFIKRHREQPWFLCVAYNAVHSPLQAKTETLKRFQSIEDIHRRIFAAMLSDLDTCIGRLVQATRQSARDRPTLIVFLSDNGGPTKELTSSNRPLRGGKGDLYEGGIRVPMILSCPGIIGPGKIIDTPVCSIDICATVVAQADTKLDTALDGIDLGLDLGQISNVTKQRSLFWRVGKKHAVRQGDWKLLRDGQAWKLFNLRDDIGESKDIAGQYPERVAALEREWLAWNAQQVDPLW